MTPEPRAGSLQVRRTARYHTLGELGPAPTELWYVLHGYGQLSADFVARFAPALTPGRCIVAPEGLSRFYSQGSSGAVGASWMTKEARGDEVADYVAYLDALHGHIAADLSSEPSITVLGFSQGAATASRWVALGDLRPQRLILWAGILAADLDLGVAGPRLTAARLGYVVGERDHWVTPEVLAGERARLASAGVELDARTFAGGHRLDDRILASL